MSYINAREAGNFGGLNMLESSMLMVGDIFSEITVGDYLFDERFKDQAVIRIMANILVIITTFMSIAPVCWCLQQRWQLPEFLAFCCIVNLQYQHGEWRKASTHTKSSRALLWLRELFCNWVKEGKHPHYVILSPFVYLSCGVLSSFITCSCCLASSMLRARDIRILASW